MGTNPKLDIWGNPTEGKRECFYCGEYYLIGDSSASNEYRNTYCSAECQEKDTLQLKMAAEAAARFTNHTNEPSPPITKPEPLAANIEEVQVGPFKLKVRKDQ